MIVVKVELWSAINGQTTELARMVIDNQGVSEDMKVGDYRARTFRGRSAKALTQAMVTGKVTREGKVIGHRRLDLHVWHLVSKALKNMGYGNA
jgi:hypothetical protein